MMHLHTPAAWDGTAARLAGSALATAARYYAQRIMPRPGGAPPLASFAARSFLISGGARLRGVHPYSRDCHLKRVRESNLYSPKEIEQHLNFKSIDLHPVHVHQFNNAFLVDGSLYINNSARIELRSESERAGFLRRRSILPISPKSDVEEAALAAGVAASTRFGHWLADEVPLQMLASSFAIPISHLRPEYLHEASYRKILNLASPLRVGTARVGRLFLVDEFAQNPSKARRYWGMRERIARLPKGNERVFLNRGHNGNTRILRNEKELLRRLSQEGFAVVDVSAPLDDLLGSLNGASVVVGVEGSHLNHALFSMAAGGTIVILNPPRRVMNTIAVIATFCDLHAGMFICQEEEDRSFHADPDELMSFIDETIADHKARRGTIERFLDELRRQPVNTPAEGYSS
jgi:hypothetical protein